MGRKKFARYPTFDYHREMMQFDRRRQRSNDPCEALYFQLDRSRERSGLDAVVLVDDEGLCVASSGDHEMCEEVAAHAAMIGDRVPCFEGVLFSDKTRWEIYLERLGISGSQFYICTVGGSKAARCVEAIRSANGATRILAQ